MKVCLGKGRRRHYQTVSFDEKANRVVLIEQRLLPHQFKIVHTRSYRETAQAIANMVVRGAGAIAAAAAYGYAQGLREFSGGKRTVFDRHKRQVFAALANARPTAVDPVNAVKWIRRRIAGRFAIEDEQAAAVAAAQKFAQSSVKECRALGAHGAGLIRPGSRLLTHCNAGWLAFVDYGSATAPMYAAQEQGKQFHVFCSETRPRSQGASLTAWELAQQGVSHQVIADNAAGRLMQLGLVDLVIVGSDRTLARTGEVVNKIGTYTKAVLAQRHGIPFYAALPLSTLDWESESGGDVPIEDRGTEEVCGAWGRTPSGRRAYVRVANPGSGALNPGFDITPPELVAGIITPAGILEPKRLMQHRRALQPQG